VNELGYSTETTESATPATEANGKPEHGDAGQATGQDTALTVRAAEDRLRPRQDVNDADWDNPQWDDEADLASEYDGDLDAIRAAYRLPPRQDVNDDTSDDSTDWDQADLDHEDDSNPDAILAADLLPPRQDVSDATSGDNHDWGEADLAAERDGDLDAPDTEDHTEGSGEDHTSDSDQAAASEPPPVTEKPDDPPAEASDNSSAAPPEQGGSSKADTSERVTELETENARQGENIADLQARLERLEHPGQAESVSKVSGKERDAGQQAEVKETKGHPRRWRIPSDAGLALGATAAGGLLTGIADKVPYIHADIAGYVATGIAVVAAGITWVRSIREAKHGHRSEDRGPDPDNAGSGGSR
jgi:hypothetical protein